MSSYLVGFTVYTLAMVGMIFLAFVVAKKTMFASPANKRDKTAFVIEESLSLAPRKTLHIVKVRDERFLISADAERTTFLTKLAEKDIKAFNLADYEDNSSQSVQYQDYQQSNLVYQNRQPIMEPQVSNKYTQYNQVQNNEQGINQNKLVRRALERMK